MRERAERGEPFLSGMFTRGEVLYADSGGEAASHREPVAIFTGEVLPQYAGDLDDSTVRELLDELRSGNARPQTRPAEMRECCLPGFRRAGFAIEIVHAKQGELAIAASGKQRGLDHLSQAWIQPNGSRYPCPWTALIMTLLTLLTLY